MPTDMKPEDAAAFDDVHKAVLDAETSAHMERVLGSALDTLKPVLEKAADKGADLLGKAAGSLLTSLLEGKMRDWGIR